MKQNINIKDIPETITAADLCRLIGITYQTLRMWTLTGRLSEGKKVYHNRIFTKEEVLKALRLQPATAKR